MRMPARCGRPSPFGQDTHRTAYCFRNLKSCQNSNFAEIETIWLRAPSLGFGNVTVKPNEKIIFKDWFFILYNCFFAIENCKFWFRDDIFFPRLIEMKIQQWITLKLRKMPRYCFVCVFSAWCLENGNISECWCTKNKAANCSIPLATYLFVLNRVLLFWKSSTAWPG